MELSIVSPVYKGEKMLDELVRRISEATETITDDYEIVLTNDGSPDNSWEGIKRICESNKKVVGVNLSRNFGQPYAITAGLSYAKGNYIVVIDCDLQNRPEEIPRLYKKAKEGYDIVFACRVKREDTFLKRMSSLVFHKVYNFLSGNNTNKEVAEFGLYSKKVIDVYLGIPEYARSFAELIQTLGFNVGTIEVLHAERAEGESSYTLKSLLKLAFDNMISNSNKPLFLAVLLGFVMSFGSFLMAIYNIIAKYLGINEVVGYTTIVFSIWFVGGLLLFMLGIVGLYIGKIFDQVKGRPIFIVKDVINTEEK